MSQKIINKLSSYAEQLLNLDGKPFSLQERKHLDLIYNHNKKKTVFIFSRQAEKSTTLAAKSLVRSCIYPFFRTLYIAPREKQVQKFSAQKLTPFINSSPKIQKHLIDKTCSTSVFFKTFKNKSDYSLESSYLSPDGARGISADALYIDELQDIIEDHLPVLESCLQHGKPWAKYREYAGTPKTLQNPINHQWLDSKQIEWVIKCSGCGKHNVLGMSNIGKFHMICSKCGKQIYAHDGQWVVTNESGKFPAFRICYLMVPWCVWNNVNDPSEPGVVQMLNDWQEAKFRNETLAESYDNAQNPIKESDFLACCEERKMAFTPDDTRGIPQNVVGGFVAGVDWGTSEEKKSRTVLTIGGRCTDGKFRVFFQKKYSAAESDPEFQVENIAMICKMWNIVIVGCDWGFGYMQNARLSRKLPPGRVQIMYTSGTQLEALKIQPKVGHFTISRSQTLTKLFLEIQTRQILFPRWEDEEDYTRGMKFFAPDFLNVGIEYCEQNRTIRYVHPKNVPDDSMHSLNYALVADMVLRNEYSTHTSDD